ncbi:FlgB family protein [Paracoccus ravus]|uniref:FlgB family protein n=1 Tax=Paracoccus ravus TaxID=2447760 RepID=UPI00106E7885|nr:FlgB family protein [Paracoccus ravus]
MFDRIDTLRMASALTTHAENRQKLIARNVANADTPGFRAQDLAPFPQSYGGGKPLELRMTRPAHVAGSGWSASSNVTDTQGEPAPNGNTVSLEEEMIRSTQAKRQFDLSLAITRASLDMIRTSLGRRA